jgi:hypothetical protein
VTPEDIKRIVRIEMAILKFDIAEILEEKISRALRKRYSEQDKASRPDCL